MILGAAKIAELLDRGREPASPDPLVITPTPDLAQLRASEAASVDLRPGTWFSSMKQARLSVTRTSQENTAARITRTYFIPFGQEFILHPMSFVLAATLEWIRLPLDLAAYVVGKSSWGRCGLIIATATGVHPGFYGCLTLELSNVGEIPIAVKPGYPIGQLFIHRVETGGSAVGHKSHFGGSRRPMFRPINLDPFADRLAGASRV